jgi:hypothetical protein
VAQQIGGCHLGNVKSSKVFATPIRRVAGRLLRVEIVWQAGIIRRCLAPRGSCRLAQSIRETQTWPPPTSRAVVLAAGELPGGERRIVRHALVKLPKQSVSECSSDRFPSRVRRGGTCGGKQTKSVRIVCGKRRLVSPPPRARRRAQPVRCETPITLERDDCASACRDDAGRATTTPRQLSFPRSGLVQCPYPMNSGPIVGSRAIRALRSDKTRGALKRL